VARNRRERRELVRETLSLLSSTFRPADSHRCCMFVQERMGLTRKNHEKIQERVDRLNVELDEKEKGALRLACCIFGTSQPGIPVALLAEAVAMRAQLESVSERLR
jgi:hypothetical protein